MVTKAAARKQKYRAKTKERNAVEHILGKGAKATQYSNICNTILHDDTQGLNPFEVYARFKSVYEAGLNDPDNTYLSDQQIGEALVVTQGYLGPLSLKHGVDVVELRKRIMATPALNAIWNMLKALHIDSAEKRLLDNARIGEGWAVKMILTSADARDRGYKLGRDDDSAADVISFDAEMEKRTKAFEARIIDVKATPIPEITIPADEVPKGLEWLKESCRVNNG